jgi:hypothetical protein
MKEAKQKKKEIEEEKKRLADERSVAWIEKVTKDWRVRN